MSNPDLEAAREIAAAVIGPEPVTPRLWDKEPEGVVHIAGALVNMFGRYLRQRCEWCGIILVEYDLERVMVPVGQEGPPASWPPGGLVRVDGNMSAAIDNPDLTPNNELRLPPDSCAFDPNTQIGSSVQLQPKVLYAIAGLDGSWKFTGKWWTVDSGQTQSDLRFRRY